MSYFKAWLPLQLENAWMIYIAIVLSSVILVGLIYLVFSKKIVIPGLIKTGVSFVCVGLYPIIDGLAVGYGGDDYAIALRFLFIITGFIFIISHFVMSFIRSNKSGSSMALVSDWTALDDK